MGKNNSMKLGIIQGRLSPPVGDFVQAFPEDWQREFKLKEKMGLNHIEWIVPLKDFDKNPIIAMDCDCFSNAGISSLCADFLVEFPIKEKIYHEFDVQLCDSMLRKVCEAARNWGIGCITLPMLENMNFAGFRVREKMLPILLRIFKDYREILFSYEIDQLGPDDLLKYLIMEPNIRFTYDTGNYEQNAPSDEHDLLIRWGRQIIPLINNVHLKDKLRGKSVHPGLGTVPFGRIFEYLSFGGYDGLFTMQFARGESGKEIGLTRKNMEKMNKLWAKQQL